ncbi:MAG: A24 family peptidase [Caulobacteraceae bacterium]|nr:A24 family peptidase [Caulobacteraceae bacterium]
MLALHLGLIGLVVGCFLGLVSVRWPADEDVAIGRSHCRACLRTLPWSDLVPVASYLWTRGRCRTCAAPIPIKYPLIELAAGGLGVWAALAGSTVTEAILTALLGWQLLLIAVIDLEHHWRPSRLALPLLVSGVIAAAVMDRLTVLDAIIGAAVGFATLRSFRMIYRRRLGRDDLGDGAPLLAAAVGAWMGWRHLPPLLLAFWFVGLASVIVKSLLTKPATGGARMRFGPLLAIATFAVWSWRI